MVRVFSALYAPVIPNALFSPPQSYGNQYRGCGVLTYSLHVAISKYKKKSRFTDRASPAFLFFFLYITALRSTLLDGE